MDYETRTPLEREIASMLDPNGVPSTSPDDWKAAAIRSLGQTSPDLQALAAFLFILDDIDQRLKRKVLYERLDPESDNRYSDEVNPTNSIQI